MHRGFVLLWRKVEDSGWIRNHKLWAFWSWCLIKASYNKRKVLFGRQKIDLEPGQFIMGRRSASQETGLSEQEVRATSRFLENHENITIKTTNKFSIVSIVNWDSYQNTNTKINQQINQQSTNRCSNSNHKQYINKSLKNKYSPDFEQFYAAYPKKRDPDRAWKAWQNRNGDRPEVTILISAINKQKESSDWKKERGKYIPYPATWLNAGSWKNEVDIEPYDPFG